MSETMLIDGVNYKDEVERIAEFLGGLAKLDKAYVAVPTRPPAEGWVRPAGGEAVSMAFRAFAERLGGDRVERLVGHEGDDFTPTGDVKEDLLGITAVHPMREEAVEEFLRRGGLGWRVVDELLHGGKLVRLEYEGRVYYVRRGSSLERLHDATS